MDLYKKIDKSIFKYGTTIPQILTRGQKADERSNGTGGNYLNASERLQ